jgi:hypothetical protein
MRENGYLYPRGELHCELPEKLQARPCSMAKRAAAVRELTPSLW